MIGMVFGSAGTPFWPWQAAQNCAFASISSAAYAGMAVIAKPTAAPAIVENRRVSIARFLPPVTTHGASNRKYPDNARRTQPDPDMLGPFLHSVRQIWR